jgi:hypothetical protein
MEKLNEGDVFELVLDYLSTKGFTETERTLRKEKTNGSPQTHGKSSSGASGKHRSLRMQCVHICTTHAQIPGAGFCDGLTESMLYERQHVNCISFSLQILRSPICQSHLRY